MSMNNLVEVLGRQGKYVETEESFRRVLDGFEKV